MINRILILLALFWVKPGFSQDTVHISPVVVEARQPLFDLFTDTLHAEKKMEFLVFSDLSEALQQETGFYQRQYAPGGLSTLALKGTGSQHSTVLWNGFDIASPMNGTTDLALIPNIASNRILLQEGGQSALSGSGSIGGSLLIQPDYQVKGRGFIRGGQQFGDFGLRSNFASVGLRKGHFHSQTHVWRRSSDNDFDYQNRLRPGNPVEQQRHAAIEQAALIQTNQFTTGKHSFLRTAIWYGQNKREIAPTLVESFPDGVQEDDFLRLSGQWVTWRKNWSLRLKTAWFIDELTYTSHRFDGSDSRVQNIYVEPEIRYHLADGYLSLAVQYNYQEAETNVFQSLQIRRRMGILLGWRQQIGEKWVVNGSLRHEWVNPSISEWTGSLQTAYEISSNGQVYLQGARNFRVPTFNDHFWPGAGNPDLRPEKSHQGEGGFRWLYESGVRRYRFSISGFSLWAQDWIQWVPVHATIWRPENIKTVWSRGLATDLSFHSSWGDWKLQTEGHYRFTKTTNRKTRPAQTAQEGKQLIYVPEHQVQLGLEMRWKLLRVDYRHQWIGERFTSPDNSQSLEAYHLGHAGISANVRLWEATTTMGFRLHNVWNTSYETIAFRPMPLRYWTIHLQFNLPVQKD